MGGIFPGLKKLMILLASFMVSSVNRSKRERSVIPQQGEALVLPRISLLLFWAKNGKNISFDSVVLIPCSSKRTETNFFVYATNPSKLFIL